jgi:hypothetical protein
MERIAFGIQTFVPKTRETTNLLDRVLFSDKDLQAATRSADSSANPEADFRVRSTRRRERAFLDPTRGRSAWWVVGTSLLFEAFVLSLAAWIFCRRDY